ncbi:hypothetical protein ABZY45_26135 [Streptomyces sp. NPDC006516]|uniref:hypothetical protein n=1 Tax=Streptomyces sp. NPDC006516 TaxID=3154309 RepID=UPI0033ABE023
MSTSDQDQDQKRDQERDAQRDPAAPDAQRGPAARDTPGPAPEDREQEEDLRAAEIPEPAARVGRLTPRQARRLRILLSSVGMAAMAVVLALRIASRSSVLVVGVYGLALILCGLVIELSRNGRTRLGSWLLGVGLVAAVGADWLLIP